jgi:hypothetical protein
LAHFESSVKLASVAPQVVPYLSPIRTLPKGKPFYGPAPSQLANLRRLGLLVSEASCSLGRLVEFVQARDSFSDRSTRTAFATKATEITPDMLAHVKCGGQKPKMASGRRGQAQHRPAERGRISREWDLFQVAILTRFRTHRHTLPREPPRPSSRCPRWWSRDGTCQGAGCG